MVGGDSSPEQFRRPPSPTALMADCLSLAMDFVCPVRPGIQQGQVPEVNVGRRQAFSTKLGDYRLRDLERLFDGVRLSAPRSGASILDLRIVQYRSSAKKSSRTNTNTSIKQSDLQSLPRSLPKALSVFTSGKARCAQHTCRCDD